MPDNDTTTDTLADALPREITRVRETQDHYKAMRGRPNLIVEPAIMMMEAEIQAAIRACAAGDVVEMLRSLKTLREYE